MKKTIAKCIIIVVISFPRHVTPSNPCVPPVLVSIHSQQEYAPSEWTKSIEFCQSCMNPRKEGSRVNSLLAARGTRDFEVVAEIVFAVPNDGSSKVIMNANQVEGKIVLFYRGGGVPLVEKILVAQEDGAEGVIIVDDGNCNESFSSCGRGSGSARQGFAPTDHWTLWEKVKIACLLVTKDGGKRITDLIPFTFTNIPGFGDQKVSTRLDEGACYESDEL